MTVGVQGPRQFQGLFDVIPFVVSLNPANLVDGAGETLSIAVPGAELGDFVLITPTIDQRGLLVSAYVESAGNVDLRIQNETASTINLEVGDWNGIVLKPKANVYAQL